MAHINDIHSILVTAANANFSADTYTQIYAGAAASPTINGVVISMAAGSSLNIMVRTISATANVYLLGERQNVNQGSPNVN